MTPREEFERFYKKDNNLVAGHRVIFEERSDGSYSNQKVQDQWRCWQAATAAAEARYKPVVEAAKNVINSFDNTLCDPDEDCEDCATVNELRQAIRDLGVDSDA